MCIKKSLILTGEKKAILSKNRAEKNICQLLKQKFVSTVTRNYKTLRMCSFIEINEMHRYNVSCILI